MKSIIYMSAAFAASSLFLAVMLGSGSRTPWNGFGIGVIIIAAIIVGAVQNRNARIVALEAMAGAFLGLGLMTLLFPAS